MRQALLLTLFLISGLKGFPQDPVFVYLAADFTPTSKDNATYIRETIIKNKLYCMTDKKINGTIINYCEYISLNPMVENGMAIHFDERDSIYSRGNYSNGLMTGKWIYYNKDYSADTIDYSFDKGSSGINNIQKAEYYFYNKGTEKTGKIIFEVLPSFINTNFHMPTRALRAGHKDVSLNIDCIIDTEGKVRNPEILNVVHPDITQEVHRILSLYKYDGEIKKPFKITLTGFNYGENGFDEKAPGEVFVVVEEMPVFKGGNKALLKFIKDNLKYPDELSESSITGTVILRFCVNYKGKVELISISRGAHPLLNEEAVRVVSMLPDFKPGKQGGKPVNVWYSLPIMFSLK